jgi:hypothetical protein
MTRHDLYALAVIILLLVAYMVLVCLVEPFAPERFRP